MPVADPVLCLSRTHFEQTMSLKTLAFFACLLLSAVLPAQGSFVNFESAPVHPIRVSPDGSRLFVLSPGDNSLEVYSLANPDAPLLLKRIPVGLEPVSMAVRSNDEVWVATSLSDSISIVSVAAGRVIDVLRVKDEPADVCFAGNPLRAFVSVSASDEVRVFDPATRASLGTIPIFGKDPRALVASADGTKVYCAVHHSGNGTTVVKPSLAPAPPLPTNPNLAPAPQQGIIVRADDPAYQSVVTISLPDIDVVEIDAATLAITRTFSGVGTTLYDLDVDAATGDLYVVGTDARNLVRFEPAVRGHVIDSLVTRITTGALPTVTPIDLNAGLDYSTLPNPAALATALAEPVSVLAAGGTLYVAAQGTDRIGVLATPGTIQNRIDLGSTSTLDKRGPRGLARHPSAPRLYVNNRLSGSISIIDTATNAVLAEKPWAHDPTPQAIKDGRKFLYDTKLSGNGTMSCGSCHIDGDTDFLAWDLGDPAGSYAPTPIQPPPFDFMIPASFHPMKGPMVTQTLRGLSPIAPLHWRGDRADLSAFNGAFASLLGAQPLGAADLALFTGFMASIAMPPNPNQNLDRSYATTPASNNPAEGLNVFVNTFVMSSFGVPASCASCHGSLEGTNGMLIAGFVLSQSQPIKVPQLRNLYRKAGFSASGPSKLGFGFTHDGVEPTVGSFLARPSFQNWPTAKKDDLESFVMAFDTGTAPIVGYQTLVTAANATAAPTIADLNLLESQAAAGNCNLIVKGVDLGLVRGFAYDPNTGLYYGDDPSMPPLSRSSLLAGLIASTDSLMFLGVPPGTGLRLGIDRDLDGLLDSAEGATAYGLPVTGGAGVLYLGANRDPRIATFDFALIASGAPAQTSGLLAISPFPAAIPYLGLTAYVDFTVPGFLTFPLLADADRVAAFPASIGNIPALIGYTISLQAAFADPLAPAGITASNGLTLTIMP